MNKTKILLPITSLVATASAVMPLTMLTSCSCITGANKFDIWKDGEFVAKDWEPACETAIGEVSTDDGLRNLFLDGVSKDSEILREEIKSKFFRIYEDGETDAKDIWVKTSDLGSNKETKTLSAHFEEYVELNDGTIKTHRDISYKNIPIYGSCATGEQYKYTIGTKVEEVSTLKNNTEWSVSGTILVNGEYQPISFNYNTADTILSSPTFKEIWSYFSINSYYLHNVTYRGK